MRLGDLPSILRSLPHLSRDDMAAFGKDVEKARHDLREFERVPGLEVEEWR